MLQLPESRNNIPSKKSRGSSRPKESARSIISASIMPIGNDPDLLDELCYLSERNDIDGLVALYDAYSSAAKGYLLIQNQPRVSERVDDFIERERCHALAKAYLVADFLKGLRPDKHRVERYVRVLFDCAFEMGNDLPDVVALIQEISEASQP
jgi:hypothetical protein